MMISPTPSTTAGNGMNPLAILLRLFSSVRFGITLLAVLFVYSSLGSAGLWLPGYGFIAIRQWPIFEMTEFEWFHWWPFKLMIALICANLIVATLRRIKFKPVNYGVWMIHSGIIILCIGSVIYFSTKVEGDAPIIRRRVVIELPTGETASLEAIPGNQILVGAEPNAYAARISNIDPKWEILSGDDKGKRAYAISVAMQSQATGDRFIRQLLVGYPQYTEDTIPTGNPQQPFARAIKQIGKPLADESIHMRVDYEPQKYFYFAENITKCFALYVRPLGEKAWTERPIEGMPLYNDYIGSTSDVWLPASESIPLRTLDVTVPAASESDPFPSDMRVTSYLRYATMEQRKLPGGQTLDPVVAVRLNAPGSPSEEYTLSAFDPQNRSVARGLLQFRWITSMDDLEKMMEVVEPALIWTDPATGEQRTLLITTVTRVNPDAPFIPIEGTDYSYRVEFIDSELEITPGRSASIASIEVKTPERSFRRWVFTDPSFNRDMALMPANPHAAPDMHEQTLPFDDSLQLALRAGKRPPPVSLIAGPTENDFGMLIAAAGAEPRYQQLKTGDVADLSQGITLEVLRYAALTRTEVRPFVVPRAQRNKDIGIHNAMVKVELPGSDGTNSYWIPYHHWPFEDANEAMRRFPYRPVVVEGSNGKKYEMLLSRHRLPLPFPVVLEDFELKTQLGGFTGSNLSVRDWTSVVKFKEGENWSSPLRVSVNAPVEYGGLSYFQAQWDPPMNPRFEGDVPSAGLNYTVLGVGSRHGVNIQLAGCIIAVLGMIYAFYIKPYIRRRERDRVLAAAQARAAQVNASAATAAARRPQELVSLSASEVEGSPS